MLFFLWLIFFKGKWLWASGLSHTTSIGRKKKRVQLCEVGVKVWGRVAELFGRNFCMRITSSELTRGNTGESYLLLFFCLSNW